MTAPASDRWAFVRLAIGPVIRKGSPEGTRFVIELDVLRRSPCGDGFTELPAPRSNPAGSKPR